MTNSLEQYPNFDDAETRMQQLAEHLTNFPGLTDILPKELYKRDMLISSGAYLLLIIPVYDALRLQAERQRVGIEVPELDVNIGTLQSSIQDLLDEMEADPADADAVANDLDSNRIVERPTRMLRRRPPVGPRTSFRTSLSVIKAFWKRYCNIPPFCGQVRRSRER